MATGLYATHAFSRELKSPKFPYGPFMSYSSIYSYVPCKGSETYGYNSTFRTPPPPAQEIPSTVSHTLH